MTAPSGAAAIRFLQRPGGAAIAYRRDAAAPGQAGSELPGVVFLGGFASDMAGTKATALAQICARRNQAYLRFDYTGHGRSTGAFRDGTIGGWTDDAVAVLDEATHGPQILVGSSMGGWIMLLVALARSDRVAGLVGIASAPDFTEDLVWEPMAPDLRGRLRREGAIRRPSAYEESGYEITWRLIEEGRAHLLLRAPIAIRCPVRLLHGTADPDVPWQVSLRLLERLASADATLTLIKDGDHRLSREADIARIGAAVAELSAPR